MLSAIVLAAGLSSRMGAENKLLLTYKNKTIIATIVENILGAGIENVIIVTGHESVAIKNALDHLPVQFVYNSRFAWGLTTSIQQGVMAAATNGYMICLSDMVTITSAEYELLKNAFETRILIDNHCICLPRYNNEKGNPVIFSAFYKEAILQNQEREGCKNIIQSNKENIYWVDMETPHILEDFDYPEDYNRLI